MRADLLLHHLVPVAMYVGPDAILPLTSAIGAAVGVILMFWTRVKALTCRLFNSITKRRTATTVSREGDQGS